MGSGAISYAGGRIIANRPLSLLHPPPPYIMEDFLIDVLADSPYITVTSSGTATTAAAISASAGDPVAGYGGWLAGATDDVDADDPTEGTGTNGALNIQTAYTLVDVADDAAGFIFSSLATVPTWWKIGSTDSTVGSTMAAANDAFLGVADTWIGLRVEVDVNGDSFFYSRALRGGSLTSYGKTNVGLSPDVLLVPLFTAAPTTTTAVPWEIDYCFVAAGPI